LRNIVQEILLMGNRALAGLLQRNHSRGIEQGNHSPASVVEHVGAEISNGSCGAKPNLAWCGVWQRLSVAMPVDRAYG
jgi:hypothetical protein